MLTRCSSFTAADTWSLDCTLVCASAGSAALERTSCACLLFMLPIAALSLPSSSLTVSKLCRPSAAAFVGQQNAAHLRSNVRDSMSRFEFLPSLAPWLTRSWVRASRWA